MKYLGIDAENLTDLGGIHTAGEIAQQPEIWKKIWLQVNEDKSSITQFLNEALSQSKRIILTGAGTSAFIGLSLQRVFQLETGILTEAISTTDIVSHPKDYFINEVTTLLISFARSGNSPESVAAIKLADEFCDTCYHLIITCNEGGELANFNTVSPKFVVTLPKESNDVSLAMTSSYSGMLLAGLLLAKINELETLESNVATVIDYAQQFIFQHAEAFREIAKLNFKRVVFLGAGSFYGTATEAALKVQELTNGEVIAKNDSFLGFRHGPKAVVNESTLLVYFLSSSDEYALRYELDLINSMKKGTSSMLEIGISETAVSELNLAYMFYFSENGKKLDDDFLPLCYILPAQLLGFYKSIQLGLHPDSPSVNNDISRVVEGVQIYSI